MLSAILTKLLFLIAVLDPLGAIPVYLDATKQLEPAQKRKVAIRGSLLAFLILLFFVIVGQLLLEVMHVTLDAFQVSGGVILFLFSLTMIFGEEKHGHADGEQPDYKHIVIFPIAMPAIASPGAILSVVLLTDNYTYPVQEQIITSILILVVVVLIMIALLGANKIQKHLGEYGITIISKIMGLILAAYAVQNILSGIQHFFSIPPVH